MIQNYFDNVKRILGSLISNAAHPEGETSFPYGAGGGLGWGQHLLWRRIFAKRNTKFDERKRWAGFMSFRAEIVAQNGFALRSVIATIF